MSQRPDVDLAREIQALKREKPKNTRAEIAARLNVSVRTVANYSNRRWLAERGLAHLPDVDQELQDPLSAVETQAWMLCQSGDHDWLKMALYEGHAFRVTEVIREQPGDLGSTIRDVYRVKACGFCGVSVEEKMFSSIGV